MELFLIVEKLFLISALFPKLKHKGFSWEYSLLLQGNYIFAVQGSSKTTCINQKSNLLEINKNRYGYQEIMLLLSKWAYLSSSHTQLAPWGIKYKGGTDFGSYHTIWINTYFWEHRAPEIHVKWFAGVSLYKIILKFTTATLKTKWSRAV